MDSEQKRHGLAFEAVNDLDWSLGLYDEARLADAHE